MTEMKDEQIFEEETKEKLGIGVKKWQRGKIKFFPVN